MTPVLEPSCGRIQAAEMINLQEKAHVLPGTVESYWFENEQIGLAKTLFHRASIPLEDFDSGLEYVEQPESTQIIFDWYELKLDDAAALDGINLSHTVTWLNVKCTKSIA